MAEIVKGVMPTVPEYYRTFIDKNANLLESPKQFCPFHDDGSRPSFSYMPEKGVWRCFGACGVGGDVIDLHKKNYKISTREEAERSIRSIYGVIDKLELRTGLEHIEQKINQYKIDLDHVYQVLIILADKDVERWLELDYIMSKYPPDLLELQSLSAKWRGIKQELEIDYEREFIEEYYEMFDEDPAE